jgi:DNA-binding GntR family transcriptional regulator
MKQDASTIDTLAQQAYIAIRQKIQDGELAAGTRLVNRVLAADLGLSMTPIREAINRLSSDGVIEFSPGIGAVVRRLHVNDLEQIFDLRENLEPLAAAEAAYHASPSQLEVLEALAEQGEVLTQRPPAQKSPGAIMSNSNEWAKLESSFHLAIARASNNPWLVSFIESLRLLHGVALSHQSIEHPPMNRNSALQIAEDHSRLCWAIRERNSEVAHEVMKEHIELERETILRRTSSLLKVDYQSSLTCP